MLLVNERGDSFHIDEDLIPQNAQEWLNNKSYMFSEDVELEECWVACVNKRNFDSKEYEYVGEKVYDHEPTKEELLWLMANHDALRLSYVVVDKALRFREQYD